MNLDFIKDLVSLNPIKTSYVSNNLRANFNFIVDDHVREKELDDKGVTLLDKLYKIFTLFLEDELDRELLYDLFGSRLNLTKKQFYYLYDRTKEDVCTVNLARSMCRVIKNAHPHIVKSHLMNTIDDQDGFANMSIFLIRECNNAAKIK
uniref:ORF108 n=1 Tax=Cydia pomonella granulosis virus TaxID=28289 RepID=A0A097P0U1_GVCP|nr:ORF108 [Cydia pomonella granulovirus]